MARSSQLYSDAPAPPVAPAASAALVASDSPSRLSPQAVDAALAWQMAAEAPASRPLFRPRWLRAR